MYDFDQIRRVHLEVTTRCNAACPQCPRNVHGGATNPNLPLTEMSLEQVKRIFQPAFLRQLVHITMCGNYGDAMSAHGLIEICRYFKLVAPWIDLEVHTNGSARSIDIWRELAACIDRCVFAIDGLEDTNHIYRRRTHWESIVRNAKAFIAAGGCAEWNYIVFEHNEHQVEKASDLARQLGFRKFFVKRTGRFAKRGTVLDDYPIMDVAGNIVGSLRVASSVKLRNPAVDALKTAVDNGADYDELLATTNIRCSVAEAKSIYISAEGLVFPCCWMAQIYPSGKISSRKQQILQLLNDYGENFRAIDANLRSIEAIIGGEFFQMGVPNGWGVGDDRLKICARQCGEYRLSSAQKGASLI
jgi:MoaA/NifB/PqqE/SkfB family radical SAM enzyme